MIRISQHQTFLFSSLVSIMLSALASSASAWTISMTFENGSYGQPCTQSGDFGWQAGPTEYDTAQSADGQQSCKMHIHQGGTEWGAGFVFPQAVYKGGEIWYRWRTFMPDSFNFNADTALKFVRCKIYSAEGQRVGMNDIQIVREDWHNHPEFMSSIGFIQEGESWWYWAGDQGSAKPIKGRWETWEMYLRLDNADADDGGNSMVRFWKDGELIMETPQRRTLESDTDFVSECYFSSWWNGGSPQDQYLWVDDVVVTNSNPGNQDLFGNPFIGPGEMISPPLPPQAIVN